MKKLLSLFCLMLCLCMIVSCFAGCGGKQTIVESEIWLDEDGENVGSDSEEDNESGDSPNTDNSNNANNSKNSSKNNITVNKDGTYNFGGATVVMAGWDKQPAPLTTSSTYKKELELVSKIEKKYNCKIQWKHVADSLKYYKTFTTTAMAGTKFADIIKAPGDQAFPNAIANGIVWQLDSFMTGFDDVTMWADVVDGALKVNGKHYFLAPAEAAHDYAGLFFNQNVLDACGVKTNPHDYMKEGKWNWDNFLKIAKACTKEDKSYYGFARHGARYWIRSNGGKYWKTNSDGTQSFNFDDPLCIEGIQFAHDLVKVHKVVPESKGADLFTQGKVAMDVQRYNYYWYTDFKYAEVPIGPKAKDYIDDCAACHLWAIPKAVKESNVPAVLAVLKEYIDPTYKWRETLEERAYSWYNDEESVKYVIAHIRRFDNTKKYWNTYYPYSFTNVYSGDFGIADGLTPQGFIQKHQAKAEAEIKNIWNSVNKKTK